MNRWWWRVIPRRSFHGSALCRGNPAPERTTPLHALQTVADLRKFVRDKLRATTAKENAIDWDQLAAQQFHGRASSLDLLYLYEFGEDRDKLPVTSPSSSSSSSSSSPDRSTGSGASPSSTRRSSSDHPSPSARTRRFTPAEDARLLALCKDLNPSAVPKSTQQELVAEMNGHFTFRQLMARFRYLQTDRAWSEQDAQDLLRSYCEGKETIPEFAARHRRSTSGCERKLRELLQASRDGRANGTNFATIFVRRQYQVLGPNWKALQQFVVTSPVLLRRKIQYTQPFWFQLPTLAYAGSVNSFQYTVRWTATEMTRLDQLVKEEMKRVRKSSGAEPHRQPTTISDPLVDSRVDWVHIGECLGRSAEACIRRYQVMMENRLRSGYFSAQEDRALLQYWMEHKMYPGPNVIPTRPYSSVCARFRRLLEQHVQQKSQGHWLATELDISIAEAHDFLQKVRRKSRGESEGNPQ